MEERALLLHLRKVIPTTGIVQLQDRGRNSLESRYLWTSQRVLKGSFRCKAVEKSRYYQELLIKF